MDVKKIGRIPDGGGWRAHGRPATAADTMRQPKIGYDYVHSLVDDHSRLAYSEILTDETAAPPARGSCSAPPPTSPPTAIPRIERLITDNAWAYRNSTAVSKQLRHLGAQHMFIKPHCPWQNGKVERLNRTLQIEWAYRQVFLSNDRPCRRPCTLAGALQHSTPPHRTRRPPANQPTVTNLMTGYT